MNLLSGKLGRRKGNPCQLCCCSSNYKSYSRGVRRLQWRWKRHHLGGWETWVHHVSSGDNVSVDDNRVPQKAWSLQEGFSKGPSGRRPPSHLLQVWDGCNKIYREKERDLSHTTFISVYCYNSILLIIVVWVGDNMIYIGCGTICNFRHALGGLERIPCR